MTNTYTNKDLVLHCDNWEEFGGGTFSDNHAIKIDGYGNMRLVNVSDGSIFNDEAVSADYFMSFGSSATKSECVRFVNDYVNAWMDAARDEYDQYMN